MWFEREAVFSWAMLTLPVAFLIAMVGYPFAYGVVLSFEHAPVAHVHTWAGFDNFILDSQDPIFWKVVWNTVLFTTVATIFKLAGGLGMALVMHQEFQGKSMLRALLLLPFIVPTVLSVVAWMWILDPAFSVVTWFLVHSGLAKTGPSWLGNPHWAMASVIFVNIWRGLPFFGISILSGLQSIPQEMYEAATIDGAGMWGRFRFVTWPLLRPVALIVTMFSIIFTFFDFQLVYVLTGGGPANATHLMATYAFNVALNGGQIGLGASIALAMLPVLAMLIVAMTFYMKKA